MAQSPVNILNLFVTPPGSSIFFLIVIAICAAGMLMALGERLRAPHDRASGRYTLAAGGAVVAWMIVMLGALFALLTNQTPTAVLPPLERACSAVVLLLIGWAFITADDPSWSRAPDLIVILLLIAFILGYTITGLQWPDRVGKTDFNLSEFGLAWAVIPNLLALFGILLVMAYFRRIADAPLKLVFFAVLLLGYGGTTLQIAQGQIVGDDMGLARLAFLAALPILLAVIYRHVINNLQHEMLFQHDARPSPTPDIHPPSAPSDPSAPVVTPTGSAPLLTPIQRDSVQLLRTLGLILEEADPVDIPQRIITAALEVLKADIGALLTMQDANYADVIAAYNREGKTAITGMALNLDNQPTLVNSIERRLQRPLFTDRNNEELRDLYNRLDVEGMGPAYFQPLASGSRLVAVLMVANPYNSHELGEAERELLKGIGIVAGSLLSLSFAARDARLKAEEHAIEALVRGVPLDAVSDTNAAAARQELQGHLQLARDQVQQLNQQVAQLRLELDRERSRVSEALGDTEEGISVSQRILALNDEQQRLREEREQLAARLQEAEAALAGATAASGGSANRIFVEALRREKDELLAQRDALAAQLDELRREGLSTLPNSVQAAIERMGQEKARLEIERDQLSSKLADLEAQLAALGIEAAPDRLAQIIGQLIEQRTLLQTKMDTLILERDALLNERRQFETRIQQEKERENRIQALQTEISHLAADREATAKAYEQIRIQYDEAVAKQDAMKQQRARLLAEASAYQMQLAEAEQDKAKLRVQLHQLQDERSDLLSQVSRLSAEKQALETARDQLLARFEGDRTRLQQAGEDGIGSLMHMIEELTEQRAALERQLSDSASKMAALQDQLDAQPAPPPSEVTSSKHYGMEIMLSMIQELRTPMTSIVGYIDLLLDEAAGILGEMQRKFLQRVAANVTRMTYMLNDLTRIAASEDDQFVLMRQSVDVVTLLEDTISGAAHQFREKGLTVHLNLDDDVPPIQADIDAISQIISQLINNAYLAAPQDSPIFITAHRQEVKLSSNPRFSAPIDSLLISVEDRGGGIMPEDLPRVFARKYKAENPLIQGLGDTGVGLSIARTLAEAHGGGLWLETRAGIGSIFYFALPINAALEPEG